MIEQAQAVEVFGVSKIVGWFIICAVVAAFVAWGVAEFANRKLLRPWKASLRKRGIEPGWYWTAIVGSVAAAAGSLAGLAIASWPVVPLSLLVGAVVGLAAGLQPVWIVKLTKRKAAGVGPS
jgi:hypothetical protein